MSETTSAALLDQLKAMVRAGMAIEAASIAERSALSASELCYLHVYAYLWALEEPDFASRRTPWDFAWHRVFGARV